MCDSHVVQNDEEYLQEPSGQTSVREAAREPMDKALVARLVLGAVIVAAFATFALQNTEQVTTQFLGWSFQLSQFLTMLLSAIAGVLIWEIASAYSRRAKKKRN